MTSFIHNKAGLIGFRSALIGSLLFAIVEGITLGTNETTINAEDIRSRLSWSILVFCISCILSIVPGYFGGRILEWLKQKSNLSLRSLMMVGAILGTITVILISLPDLLVVLAAHNYWSIIHNPAFTIYITRLIEVITIAGLMGSWSGSLITKS